LRSSIEQLYNDKIIPSPSELRLQQIPGFQLLPCIAKHVTTPPSFLREFAFQEKQAKGAGNSNGLGFDSLLLSECSAYIF